MTRFTPYVEVAFANQPNDADSITTWTNITSKVRSVDVPRGRNQELESYEASQCTVVLSNADRAFDPTYTAGPYLDDAGNSQVLPMKRIRIRAQQIGQAYKANTTGYATAPDSVALSPVAGVVDYFIKIALDDWANLASGVTQELMTKTDATHNTEWRFENNGSLSFIFGGTTIQIVPSAGTFADLHGWQNGQPVWLRVRFANAGVPGSDLIFSYSLDAALDGANFFELGRTAVSSMADTTSALYVGSFAGSVPFLGSVYNFEMDVNGVPVAKIDFTDPAQWTLGATAGASHADGLGNTFTLAGNGAISTVLTGLQPLFEGYVDEWKQDYEAPNESICTMTATDGFKILQAVDINVSPFGLDAPQFAPKYWFRLNEPLGATTVYNNLDPTITGTVHGSASVLGAQGLLYYDADTAWTLTNARTTSDYIDVAATGSIASSTQAIRFQQREGPSDVINAVTTPDTADTDGYAASIDIRVNLLWPAPNGQFQYLFGKGGYGSTTSQGYFCYITPDGHLGLYLTGSTGTRIGTTATAQVPTAQIGTYTNVAFTAENLSGNAWTVKFWNNTAGAPAADVTTWTQIGSSTVRDLASGTLAANAILPTVGAKGAQDTTHSAGNGSLQTRIVKVALRNSLNGTVVASPDFSDTLQWAVGDGGSTTGTDSTGKVWTIRNSAAASPPPDIVGGTAAAMSVSAVVQWDTSVAIGNSPTIFMQGGSATTYYSILTDATGHAVFQVRASGGGLATATSTQLVQDGEIHHIVGTYSSLGVINVYVDGVVTAGVTAVRAVTNSNFYFGTPNPAAANKTWAGTLDEMMVWDYDLSAATVTSIYNLTVAPWANDFTGARLNRILDAAGWSTFKRNIDTGNAKMQSTALQGSALDLAQNVSLSELFGELFIDKSGNVRYVQRTNTYGKSSVLSVGDEEQVTLNAFAPVQSFTPDYGDWLIRNNATITRNGGVPQRVQSLVSQGAYLIHSYSLSGLNHNSDDLSALAAAKIIEQYAQPSLRVSQVVINLNSYEMTNANLFALVGLELGDWITVAFTPQDLGTAISIVSVVEKITHSVSDGGKSWIMTLNLSPAPTGISAVSGAGAASPAPPGAPLPSIANLNDTVAVIEAQLANTQPLDATLTALAGLNATAGIVIETAADTFTKRSLAAGVGIAITNPTLAAGNASISVDASQAGIVTSGTATTTHTLAVQTLQKYLTNNSSTGVVIADIRITLTVAIAVTAATGVVANGTSIGTMPAGFRPPNTIAFTGFADNTSANHGIVSGIITTAGDIQIRNTSPNTTLPIGTNIYVQAQFNI